MNTNWNFHFKHFASLRFFVHCLLRIFLLRYVLCGNTRQQATCPPQCTWNRQDFKFKRSVVDCSALLGDSGRCSIEFSYLFSDHREWQEWAGRPVDRSNRRVIATAFPIVRILCIFVFVRICPRNSAELIHVDRFSFYSIRSQREWWEWSEKRCEKRCHDDDSVHGKYLRAYTLHTNADRSKKRTNDRINEHIWPTNKRREKQAFKLLVRHDGCVHL